MLESAESGSGLYVSAEFLIDFLTVHYKYGLQNTFLAPRVVK